MEPNDHNRDLEHGMHVANCRSDAENIVTEEAATLLARTTLTTAKKKEPADAVFVPPTAKRNCALRVFLCLLGFLCFLSFFVFQYVRVAAKQNDIVSKATTLASARGFCKFAVVDEAAIFPDNGYKPDEHPYVEKCKNAEHQPVMTLTDWDTGVISINDNVGSGIDLNRTICKVLQEKHIGINGYFPMDGPNWVSWYPKQRTIQIEDEVALVWCSMCLTKNTTCDPTVDRDHQYWGPSRWIPDIKPTMPSANAAGRYNIHMIVLESTSDALVRRRMKKSFDTMTKTLNFTHFKQHSRFGENTYPNMMAVLSGRRAMQPRGEEELVAQNSNDHGITYWDDQPMLWNDLRSLGYVTHFAEDKPHGGIFKYNMRGFRQKPTDFYGGTFLSMYEQAPIEAVRGSSGDMGGVGNLCLYGYTSTHYLYDYAVRLHQKYATAEEKPYWSLTRIGYAHERANPSHMDAYFAEVLKKMVDTEAEKTMFVVMGDHGQRYGPDAAFAANPFLAVKLPGLLVKKYPQSYKWLAANADKFTTQLDVYEFLQDIARSDFHEYLLTERTHVDSHTYGHGWGTSLLRRDFNPARTCADMGLSFLECPCVNKVIDLMDSAASTKSNRHHINGVGAAIVAWANDAVKPSAGKCLTLSLDKVTSLKMLVAAVGSEPVFQATVIVKPSGGTIIAQVVQNILSGTESEYVVKGNPERRDHWGAQNTCWRGNLGQKYNEAFCYCKGAPNAIEILLADREIEKKKR